MSGANHIATGLCHDFDPAAAERWAKRWEREFRHRWQHDANRIGKWLPRLPTPAREIEHTASAPCSRVLGLDNASVAAIAALERDINAGQQLSRVPDMEEQP